MASASAAKQNHRIDRAVDALGARVDHLLVRVESATRSVKAHDCRRARQNLADALEMFSDLRPLIEALEAVRVEMRSRPPRANASSSKASRPRTSPAAAPSPPPAARRAAPPPRRPPPPSPQPAARRAAPRRPPARPRPSCEGCGAPGERVKVNVKEPRRATRTVYVNLCNGPGCNTDRKIAQLAERALERGGS